MARAQQRDAARQGRFFFRKNVYPPGSSAASSGSVSPVDGAPLKKEKKLRNCFVTPPLPEDALESLRRHSVDEEYEEMTMNEIINGKVRRGIQLRGTLAYSAV